MNGRNRLADEVESGADGPSSSGGTPLYLKALLRGLFQGPGADVELRHRLERDAESNSGMPRSTTRLAALDPATAARLHPHDRRRIVRALEVFELTGKPISVLQAEHDRPAPADVRVFALELPRASLHDRINRRVSRFFDLGLVDEVRRIAGRRPAAMPGRRGRDRLPRGHRDAGRPSVT